MKIQVCYKQAIKELEINVDEIRSFGIVHIPVFSDDGQFDKWVKTAYISLSDDDTEGDRLVDRLWVAPSVIDKLKSGLSAFLSTTKSRLEFGAPYNFYYHVKPHGPPCAYHECGKPSIAVCDCPTCGLHICEIHSHEGSCPDCDGWDK